MDRRTFNKLLGTGLAAAATPLALGGSRAAEPLKVGFVYIGPVGDFGWTYQHDVARKEVEEHFAGAVKTAYVENVPEGPDSEHVLSDLAAKGSKLIFATSFGYMNYADRRGEEIPGGQVRALHRLQARRQRLDLQHPLLRGAIRPGRHRGQADEDRRRRLCRLDRRAGSRPGHERFPAGHAQRQSQGAVEIHPDQFLVRPGQGRRRRQGADRSGLRRHHPAHRLADAVAGRRKPRHSGVRRGDGHGQIRAEIRALGQRQRLGALLHQARPGGASTARGRAATSGAASPRAC